MPELYISVGELWYHPNTHRRYRVTGLQLPSRADLPGKVRLELLDRPKWDDGVYLVPSDYFYTLKREAHPAAAELSFSAWKLLGTMRQNPTTPVTCRAVPGLHSTGGLWGLKMMGPPLEWVHQDHVAALIDAGFIKARGLPAGHPMHSYEYVLAQEAHP